MESLKHLWLFVALNEEFLSALAVNGQEVGVKVSVISCFCFISPLSCVLVVKWQLHWFVVLLFVHLQLSWEGCLNSRLNLLNLLWVVYIIIKDLPLLDSSFVHVDLAFFDLLGSEFSLNHVLKLDSNVLVARL